LGRPNPGSDVVFATSHEHPAVFEDGVSVIKRKSAGSGVKVCQVPFTSLPAWYRR
jgi:hypothetical protein